MSVDLSLFAKRNNLSLLKRRTQRARFSASKVTSSTFSKFKNKVQMRFTTERPNRASVHQYWLNDRGIKLHSFVVWSSNVRSWSGPNSHVLRLRVVYKYMHVSMLWALYFGKVIWKRGQYGAWTPKQDTLVLTKLYIQCTCKNQRVITVCWWSPRVNKVPSMYNLIL